MPQSPTAPTDAPPSAACGGAVGASDVVVWLPAERMRRYQIAKAVGAAFFVAIFAGWLWLQWSNLFMRIVAAALLLLTVWVTFKSILVDMLRMNGREIAIVDRQHLRVIRPSPQGPRQSFVRLADIASAEWREDTTASLGLWLMDAEGRVLEHLENFFLSEQEETRMFLAWAREHAELPFDVTWPESE